MGAVVAVAGGDGCWVEFIDPEVRARCRLPLLACATIRFEMVEPARRFPSFRGQKNFSGSWRSATMGGHIGYESWMERDWLIHHPPDDGEWAATRTNSPPSAAAPHRLSCTSSPNWPPATTT